ncbi:MAG: YfhO family protein, partial [Verrucomicrobiota bacterium]
TQSQSVEVKLESVAAHRISLVTEAAAPGWITIAQSWHPSWKAIVNGVEHPIYRANHAFQAIEVPAGASRVELVYKDKAFRTGAGISIASLVLLGLLAFRNRVLTRRESAASRWITPSASSSEQTPVDWFSTGRFAIVLAGLLVVPFWKLIFGIETLFYRDFGVLAYPAIHHAKEAFWRGEIPLWNPLSNCGAPFLAQWGTMVLYPFSIFYLLLPLPWSLNVFCLAHLFLAGLGMYQLARHWTNHSFAAALAGVVYVFNGLTFSCLLWPNYTVALGWMPWVVLLVEQAWKMGGRKTIQASIVAALQMLAGVPEISVLTWLLLAGLGLGHLLRGKVQKGRFVLRSGLIVILVSGLIAAQLLPFLELLGHSQRDASFATSKWALPIWGWANLQVPLFHCFQTPQGIFFQFGQEFFSSIYLGVVPLFFGMLAAISAASKRFWFLIACFVFAILMAMGEHGVIYSWVKELIPLAGVARYPIKFLLLGLFVLPLLAAFAFATFTNSSRSLRSKTIISLGTALLLIVGIGLILLWATKSPFPYDQWPATLKCGLGRILILLAAASCFLFCIGSRSSTIQIVARLGLLLVVVVDAFQHVPVQNPTLPRYALAPGLWEMRNKFPPPKIGEGRMMISPRAEQLLLRSGVPNLYDDWLGKRLALWSHLNLIEQTPKVNGSSTLQIREQAKVQNLLYATTNASHPRLLDFLNVTLETAPGEVIEWQRRTTALPFITAGQRPVFLPRDDILERIAAADFAPGEIVYLENGAEGIPRLTNAAPAKINSPLVGFGTVEFEIEAAAPALAVIAQSYYPAWQAFVGGQPSPLHRANYAFQCLEIPPGKHQVRLQYTDRSFRLGLAISILALLACGIGWMRSKSET